MSTKAPNARKDSPAFAGPTFLLGVDRRGRHHVFRRHNRSVHVIDGTDRVHVVELDAGTDPGKWVTFIDDELCGWRTRAYAFTPAYRAHKLAEAIA